MRHFFISALLIIGFASGAHAQNYVETYKKYNAAFKAGDFVLAADLAAKALEEAKAGSAKQTTIGALATNYTIAALAGAPDQVATAYRALQAAAAEIEVGPSTEEILLGIAFGELLLSPEDKKRISAVYDALIEWADVRGGYPDVFVSSANWISTHYMTRRGLGKRAEAVNKLLFSRLWDAPPAYQGTLLVAGLRRVGYRVQPPVQGVGYGKDRYIESLREAEIILDRMASLYPSQPSVRDFDQNFAVIYAWREIVGTLLSSLDARDINDFEFEGFSVRQDKPPIIARTLSCPAIEWEERQLRYPVGVARKGYNGVVVAGFDLSKDGAIIDPIVLAEVPEKLFTSHVLKSMDRFRANVEGMPEACLTNQTTTFKFVLDR